MKYLEKHSFPPPLESWQDDQYREQRKSLTDFLSGLGYEQFCIQDEIVAQHPKFPRQIKFVVDQAGGIQMIVTR